LIAAGVTGSAPLAPAPDDALARRLEASQGVVLAALIFAMMAITFIDVIGRYLFDAPVPGAYEIITLLLGVVVYLALPLTTLREEHVTISLLRSLFRGGARRVQLTLVNLFGTIVAAAVAWRLLLQADKLAATGERLAFLKVGVAPFVYLMSAMALAAAVLHLVLALRYATGRARATEAPG
jgi:TRAP-type C4-dicarboxylate transport system permease small subunit